MWDGQGLKDPRFFFNFFYNHKIIEKSLIYEAEMGFIDKITSLRRIRYFFEFFDTLDNLEQ
jgi:hypothetical protein